MLPVCAAIYNINGDNAITIQDRRDRRVLLMKALNPKRHIIEKLIPMRDELIEKIEVQVLDGVRIGFPKEMSFNGSLKRGHNLTLPLQLPFSVVTFTGLTHPDPVAEREMKSESFYHYNIFKFYLHLCCDLSVSGIGVTLP